MSTQRIRLRIIKSILLEIGQNPSYLSPFLLWYGSKDFLKGIRPQGSYDLQSIRPLSYESPDENKTMDILTNELDWKGSPLTPLSWRSDCKIAILKNQFYIKYVGFSDYDSMRSNMLREGLMERRSALEEIDSLKFDAKSVTELLESEEIPIPKSLLLMQK
jgi:hypothetical protein